MATLQIGTAVLQGSGIARGYFDEMAANFNGLYFGILEFVFNQVWPRVFSGLEITGSETTLIVGSSAAGFAKRIRWSAPMISVFSPAGQPWLQGGSRST